MAQEGHYSDVRGDYRTAVGADFGKKTGKMAGRR